MHDKRKCVRLNRLERYKYKLYLKLSPDYDLYHLIYISIQRDYKIMAEKRETILKKILINI